MKVTKFEHSGFLIEQNGHGILIDPVEFEETLPVFQNIVAIIITHKHSDHFQPNVLQKILAVNPGAKIFTTSDTASDIPGAIVVSLGDTENVGDFKLEFFSKSHAEIVPGQVPCENIGVIINDDFAHLGDSLDMPPKQVKAIALANAAPWLKTFEAMEYIKKADASIFIPCHDAVSSELGKNISNNWLRRACDEKSAQLAVLKSAEYLEF